METTDVPTFPSDAYDAEGVDRTLIREMLELSPLERLHCSPRGWRVRS